MISLSIFCPHSSNPNFKAMPSIISHPAIAIALSPFFQKIQAPHWLIFLGAFCTIAPDFDVAGFWLGVPYEAMLGHRGLSHSLFFAAALSAFITWVLTWQYQEISRLACFTFLFLCAASHGIFDALTTGGLGVAFFAPFSNTRYFFPWRPIRVSPLSLRHFFGPRGIVVMLSEIIWMWIPALVIWGSARRINQLKKK